MKTALFVVTDKVPTFTPLILRSMFFWYPCPYTVPELFQFTVIVSPDTIFWACSSKFTLTVVFPPSLIDSGDAVNDVILLLTSRPTELELLFTEFGRSLSVELDTALSTLILFCSAELVLLFTEFGRSLSIELDIALSILVLFCSAGALGCASVLVTCFWDVWSSEELVLSVVLLLTVLICGSSCWLITVPDPVPFWVIFVLLSAYTVIPLLDDIHIDPNNENKTSPIINKSRRCLDLLLILLPPSLFSMRNTKDYHIPLYYHILIGKNSH